MKNKDNGGGKDRICGNWGYCHEIHGGQGVCYGTPPQASIFLQPKGVAGVNGMPAFEKKIQSVTPPVKVARPGCWLFKERKQ
mgnify:CR=1 FL=1